MIHPRILRFLIRTEYPHKSLAPSRGLRNPFTRAAPCPQPPCTYTQCAGCSHMQRRSCQGSRGPCALVTRLCGKPLAVSIPVRCACWAPCTCIDRLIPTEESTRASPQRAPELPHRESFPTER